MHPNSCSHPTTPRCRYCRSDWHAEITLPIWHMYEHNYSATYLATMQARERQAPWMTRKPQAYCFPGNYHRFDPDPTTGTHLSKHGVDGQRLARGVVNDTLHDALPREHLL
jgi:hypothetical protein